MKVTPEIKQQIKQLSEKHHGSAIARMLGLSPMTVSRYIGNHKPVLQNDRVRFHQRKKNVRAGYFNESERENWLV